MLSQEAFLTGYWAETKRCARCRQIKPRSDFCSNRSTRDGLACYCRSCHAEYGKQFGGRAGNAKAYRLVQRYGISVDEAREWLTYFGRQCPICGEQLANHLDHNHATGHVRGVLCSSCNQGLGNFKDRPDILRRAVAYLTGDVAA